MKSVQDNTTQVLSSPETISPQAMIHSVNWRLKTYPCGPYVQPGRCQEVTTDLQFCTPWFLWPSLRSYWARSFPGKKEFQNEIQLVTYVYTTPENYLHVFHIPFLSVHPAVGLDHSEDKVPMPRSRKLGGSGKAYVWVQRCAFSAKSSGWRNWRVAASRFMGSRGSGAPSKATTDSTTLEIR